MKAFVTTFKFFAVFMAVVLSFLTVFITTAMYIPVLAFQFTPFWEPFQENYTSGDLMIWITLSAFAFLQWVFALEYKEKHTLFFGIVGLVINIVMAFLWRDMELGTGLPIAGGVFCLILVTAYNLVATLEYIFKKNPSA